METDFFFVYGTLKQDGLYAKQFDKYRVNSESVIINNMELYKIGWFPGMIPGNGIVVGELHEYKEPTMVMALMNRIEGCDGSKQALFRREYRTITIELGKEIKANVYLFNHEVKEAKLIKNGIWINKTYKERIVIPRHKF